MKPATGKLLTLVRRGGFSLVEVALALGLTSFALLTMLGLFSVGLQDLNDSQRKVEAANALSSILEARLAAPSKSSDLDTIPAIDVQNLPVNGTTYVSSTGNKATAADSRFQLTYEIWPDPDYPKNSATRLVRLHLLLSWPAGVAPAKAVNTSEVLTSAYVKL